jgi:tetratricopeptide (TPR) repeat protein
VSYSLEKYDETIKCCEKAIEIDPDYFYAWYGKGLALHSLNKYDEAINCYNKIIENDPDHIDAWFNRKLATHSSGLLKQSS